MNQEIEKIKKEYEEKMQQKKAKKKSKDDDKAKQDTNDDASKAEKERDEKVSTWSGAKGHRSYVLTTKYIEALQTGSADAPGNDGPRIFALHRFPVQPSELIALADLSSLETSIRCVWTGSETSRLPAAISNASKIRHSFQPHRMVTLLDATLPAPVGVSAVYESHHEPPLG